MNIRTLKQQDIDRKKWDACIANAAQSLPYAHTWYLDAVAKNWDGIVYGNYEAVMPLVWLRKYGVPCMYQPYYCQQLGIFSNQSISIELQTAFMDIAASAFPYISANLNASHAPVAASYGLSEKKNLLLGLHKPYTELYQAFATNHKRNISKAEKAGLVFATNTDMPALKQFYLSSINRQRNAWFNAKAEALFNGLMDSLLLHGKANIYTANLNGDILAAMVLVPQGQRMISIINASSDAGKAVGASHFVHAKLIEKYAATGHIIDFEGSSIPSIARFYQGFGAQPEVFYHWHTNILRRTAQRFL